MQISLLFGRYVGVYFPEVLVSMVSKTDLCSNSNARGRLRVVEADKTFNI